MSIELATVIVTIFGIYLAIGVLVAVVFVIFGAAQIDPGAKGMPPQARILIFPGVMGLWPIMLAKFFTQKAPPVS